MESGLITSWQIDGETMETVRDFIFLGSKITVDGDCSHEIKRHLLLGRKAMTNLDSILKSKANTLPTKVHLVKSMVFPVVMYGSESWTIKKWVPKNWCFWTMVLEKTVESLLDSKEIKQVNPKWYQLWIFIGRTDAEAEAPTLWPCDVKNWLIRKDSDAGKDWRWEEMIEDEMVGWHHCQWTWVWTSSRRWWRTGKPGVLQSMGSRRVGHDLVTELNCDGLDLLFNQLRQFLCVCYTYYLYTDIHL